MIFVSMVFDMCQSVVDVSTLSAVSGDIFIFLHMVQDVCRSVVDVSTLSAVSGDIFMIFVHMVYDVCQSVVDVSTHFMCPQKAPKSQHSQG